MSYKKLFISLYIIFFIASMNACTKNKDWAVKIDDDVVTMDEFNSLYYTQNTVILNKSKKEIDEMAADPSLQDHPSLSKKNFLDFVIGRKLLYKKAYSDESIDKNDLDVVNDIYSLQGIASYYLAQKLKDELTVTDDEANSFYQDNRKLFQGVPINDEVARRIKQQILMKKFEKKSSEFVMELLAESKVTRDGFQKYMNQLNKTGSENKTEESSKEVGPDTVIVEIDDDKITLKNFLDYYYIQNRILLNMEKDDIDKHASDPAMADHPTLNKYNFLDFVISRKLLYKKALSDDSIDKKELESIKELFKLQGTSSYYLFKKLGEKINVTDDEINKFYRENKEHFRGVPSNDELNMRIKQQIFMQKFEQHSSKFVLSLIAESKVNREGFKNYMKEEEKKAKEEQKSSTESSNSEEKK